LLVELLGPGPDVAVADPEHRVHAPVRKGRVPGLPPEQLGVELAGCGEVAGGQLHPADRPRLVVLVLGHVRDLLSRRAPVRTSTLTRPTDTRSRPRSRGRYTGKSPPNLWKDPACPPVKTFATS